jgi:hypothetical protein
MRIGDCMQNLHKFPVIDKSCFEKAIISVCGNLNNVIWISEEEPQPLPNKYPKELNYLIDFQVIMYASAIFRSPSTFSQWAALFSSIYCSNDNVWSPVVNGKVGLINEIPFIKGNHPTIINTNTGLFGNITHTEFWI